MKKTLNTVNIIEIPDSGNMAIQKLVSYPDNKDGNALAETLFRKLVAEQTIGNVDLEIALDNGYFEDGTYYICIVHSTK